MAPGRRCSRPRPGPSRPRLRPRPRYPLPRPELCHRPRSARPAGEHPSRVGLGRGLVGQRLLRACAWGAQGGLSRGDLGHRRDLQGDDFAGAPLPGARGPRGRSSRAGRRRLSGPSRRPDGAQRHRHARGGVLGARLACRPVRARRGRSRADARARRAPARQGLGLGGRQQAPLLHDRPRRRGARRRHRGRPSTVAGRPRGRGSPRGEQAIGPPPRPLADRARDEPRLGGLSRLHRAAGEVRLPLRRPFRAVDRPRPRGARADLSCPRAPRRLRTPARRPCAWGRGEGRSGGLRLRAGCPRHRGGALSRLDRRRAHRRPLGGR